MTEGEKEGENMPENMPPAEMRARLLEVVTELPAKIRAVDSTEFKSPAVGINTLMANLGPVLRLYGFLLDIREQDVSTFVTARKQFVTEDGEKVSNDETVISYRFELNLVDVDGTPVWAPEQVTTFIRNDNRPEFWSAKARSYAVKYWLARKLMIDLGETVDDPDTDIGSQPQRPAAKKQAGKKRAAAKKAAPRRDSVTWQSMYQRWVNSLGQEGADAHWGERRKDTEPMDERTASAAQTRLAEIMKERSRVAEQAGEEPFDPDGPPPETASESDPAVPSRDAVCEQASALLFELASRDRSFDDWLAWFNAGPQRDLLGPLPDSIAGHPGDTPLKELAGAIADWLDEQTDE